MSPNDRRKIRKLIFIIEGYRNSYARADPKMSSRFARCMGLLIEALEEDKKEEIKKKENENG